MSQLASFTKEIGILIKNRCISKHSEIWKFLPILDEDGLTLMRGRTDNMGFNLTSATRQPYTLNSKHICTILLIQFYHEKFGYQGEKLVLEELRQ